MITFEHKKKQTGKNGKAEEVTSILQTVLENRQAK